LQFCGVMDVDLNHVLTNELMLYALANTKDNGDEGHHVVHYQKYVNEFGWLCASVDNKRTC